MIGETVGSYRVEAKLGQGGMGVVYVAVHPLLNKKAVVKFLHAELSNNDEIIQRFFNEARSATMIKHPGIVDVFDFGHHASGCAFILMEFLDGESLAGRLRGGPLDEAATVSIGRQIANACGAAHQRGIIHRDLKPDNVYLIPDAESTGRDRVKVLDFGIAKLAAEDAGLKTRTGSVMGTPMYMSPEQCKSAAQVDQRSDVYAVGCILYEMVCGRSPFADASGSLAQIIAAHMFEAPPALRSIAPSVSPKLEATIMKCLEKEPADRFATMSALAGELAVCAGERRPSIANATVAGAAPAPLPSRPRPAVAAVETPKPGFVTTLGDSAAEIVPSPPPSPPRGRAPVAVAGVVGVLAVGGIVYAISRGGGESGARTPATPPIATMSADASVADANLKITLEIKSTPPDARVYRLVDGVRVGKTPYTQKLEPTEGTAVYVLKLEGYEDTRVELATDRDISEQVELQPMPDKPVTKSPVAKSPVPVTKSPVTKSPVTNPPTDPPRATTGTLRPKFGTPQEPKK